MAGGADRRRGAVRRPARHTPHNIVGSVRIFTPVHQCPGALAVVCLDSWISDSIDRHWPGVRCHQWRIQPAHHEPHFVATDLSRCPAPGKISRRAANSGDRSEEHTSELQSLMRISYAVICLKKKKERT